MSTLDVLKKGLQRNYLEQLLAEKKTVRGHHNKNFSYYNEMFLLHKKQQHKKAVFPFILSLQLLLVM